MGGHARFSPSSGKRRLECPPSLLLEEHFPDEESPFAAEGSAGHAMAEYLINKYLKKRTKRPVSDYYSDELLEAVDDYVEYNLSLIHIYFLTERILPHWLNALLQKLKSWEFTVEMCFLPERQRQQKMLVGHR